MANKNKETIKVPRAVASLTHLRSKDTGHKYSDGKYKLSFNWDDPESITPIRDAAVRVAQAEWGEDVDLDEVKMPFRLPEEQTKEILEGKTTMTSRTQYKPDLRDAKRKKLPRRINIMGGDVVSGVVTLIPYESVEKVREGKKTIDVTIYGISAQLKVVQLLKKNGSDASNLLDEDEEGFDSDEYEEDDMDDEDGDDEDDEDDEDDDNDGDY